MSTRRLLWRSVSSATPTPTYGPEADWVKNVLSMLRIEMDRRGRSIALENARLVPRSDAWPHLPLFGVCGTVTKVV